MAVTRDRIVLSAGIVTLGLGLAAWRARPPGPEPPAGFLIVNGALVVTGVLLMAASAMESRRRRPTRQQEPDAAPRRPERGGYPLLGVALGTGLTALGWHAAIVFLGAMVTAWSAWLLTGREGRLPPPVAPMLTLLLLPVYRLLSTIAGPVGLAMGSLSEVPISPPAERLLVPGLLIAAWAMSGVPPFHRQLVGAFSAPAGALLLYRIGVGAMPEGIAYWRTITYPILVVGLWLSALTRRTALVAVAGGLLGVLSLDPSGVAGGFLLLGTAIGIEVASRTHGRSLAGRIALGILLALGGVEALTGTLRVEVVYSVLAAIGVGVTLATAAPNSRGYIWRDER